MVRPGVVGPHQQSHVSAGSMQGACLTGVQVIDSQHGVRFAAPEGRLQLNDRFSTFATETLWNLGQQQPHAFRDEGAVVERGGVLVFRSGLAEMDSGDVCGKFRLLEGAFKNVPVWDRDFTPRFHG